MNIVELQAQIRCIVPENLQGISEYEAKQWKCYKIMPIALLVKAYWNYKEDDAEKAEKLSNNIKRIGLVQNVMVRLLESGHYEVLNGNHRLDELIKLGFRTAIVFDFGIISLAAAQRIAIETNETNFETNETN